MTKIVGVLAQDANQWWPKIERWAEEALEHTGGLFGLDDIQEAVLLRDMQLWLVMQPELKAFCITEVSVFPKARVLTAVLTGGEDMPAWIAALDNHLTRFAIAHDCKQFNAYGRSGWRRVARGLGWVETVTYWKDLAGE